jgi:hypothetical protein
MVENETDSDHDLYRVYMKEKNEILRQCLARLANDSSYAQRF